MTPRTSLAILLAMLFASRNAEAQTRCHFLECGARDSVATVAPQPLAVAPRDNDGVLASGVGRPASPTQVCRMVAGNHTYCVSSVLAPQFGFTYGPEKLADGRLDTAWVEGKPGDGIGEWVLISPDPARRITGFEILSGYHKNADIFSKNGRVREIEIVFSDGYSQQFSLADAAGPQRFTFPRPLRPEWLQLRILSVYRGIKYRDTAISELHLITE